MWKGGENLSFFEHDDFFKSINEIRNRMMQSIFKDMQNFEEAIKAGKLKGNWDVKPITGPGMKGYVARGFFQYGDNPQNISKTALKDEREPLTDIYDKQENLEIYLELPGVEKEDIQLDVSDGFLEVKAKTFHKKLPLEVHGLDTDQITAKYNNGVLNVNIPKVQQADKEEKRTVKIE
jgi:HSP20 family protein